MALINCTECNKQISNKAIACPYCGFPFEGKATSTNLLQSQANNYVKKKLGIFEIFAGYTLTKEIVCPHCQKSGCVITRPTKVKKGISGVKATGALLTLGLSMLATGLSRKEKLTEARCKNCNSVWHF